MHASDRDFPRFVPSPVLSSHARKLRMDIDKDGRVRSYVHAQLAFVPFYGADLLDSGDPLPEVFGLRTPILSARNPLVIVQPESNSQSAPTRPEGPRVDPIQIDPLLTKKSNENQNKLLAKHHLGAKERKRSLRQRRGTTADLDSSSEPAEDRTPTKGGRRNRRQKLKLPTSLSFFHGFAPKNIGPSRLTVSCLATLRNAAPLIASRYRLAVRVFLEKGSHH